MRQRPSQVVEVSPNAVIHTTRLQCLDMYIHRRISKRTKQVCYPPLDLIPIILTVVDDHRDVQSPLNQSLQGESYFGDSSGPFFSIYSKAADVEDKKMVDRWQKDADGILFFVRSRVGIHISFCINWNTIDWSILCCGSPAPFHNRPGPEAKQSGYFSILSREHLWDSHRPECNTRIHPFPCCSTTPILSSEICHLGERTLVLKLRHRPNVCSFGNIATSMVTSIHHCHSTSMVQPRKKSANACILCLGRRQYAHPLGS